MIKGNFLNGTKVNLSNKCLQVMGSSRNGQIYELNMVADFHRRMVTRNPKATFLDIGANTGSYALIPLVNKDLTCHAFEPNPKAFEVLSENVEINNLGDNVKIYNNGMWIEPMTLELKIPLDTTDSGLSTFGDSPDRFKYDKKDGKFETHSIECKTIDTFIKETKIEKLDAIKIDTEGSELNILKGGEKLLKEQKPLILLEYDNKNTAQFGYDRTEITDYLKTLGYEHFTMYQLSDIFVY